MTRREQQTDAPEMLAPGRAMAVRESSRRQARVSREQAGTVPLPGLVPPAMQPGQPAAQLVSAETLDNLTQLMTQRINAGDAEASRRLDALESVGRPATMTDLRVRVEALMEARDHIRRLLASRAHAGVSLTVEQRVDYELRVARFLLDLE